jgi:diguanylate cyclase (GGDEF)-like protein
MRLHRNNQTRLEGRVQEWLPLIAALIGALATFGIWAYASRHRLTRRAADLERALETRTTELESARIQLQRLSTEDSLTAIANHEQFLEFLEREWRRARRDGLPLTVIFIDLDHFRAYNRQFGRKAGDEVLKEVSRVMTNIVGRPGDLVARYHRDEFAMVLASTDGQGAFNIADRLRQSIEDLQAPSAADAAARIGVGRARSDQGGAPRVARSAGQRREPGVARQSGHGRSAGARPPIK